jgi:hypothetical protein
MIKPRKDEAAAIGILVKAGKDNWIKAGKRLAAMKAKLKHGEWGSWLEKNKKKLGLGENPERAAQRLMQVAGNPTLTSEIIWGNKKALPPPTKTSVSGGDKEEDGGDEPGDSDHDEPESNGSDLPGDASDDEKEIHWAQQMSLRIDEDLRCADIDRARALTELVKILAKDLGQPEVIEGRKVADTAPTVKRGRPKGSKNKSKETKPPEQPPVAGNEVDPGESAKERGAYYDDDDISDPNHPLHRSAPDQAASA